MKITIDVPDDVIESCAMLVNDRPENLNDATTVLVAHASGGIRPRGDVATITVSVDSMTLIGAFYTIGAKAFLKAMEK